MRSQRWRAAPFYLMAITVAATVAANVFVFVREGETAVVTERDLPPLGTRVAALQATAPERPASLDAEGAAALNPGPAAETDLSLDEIGAAMADAALADSAPADPAPPAAPAEVEVTALLGPGLHLISPWRDAARISRTQERVAAMTLDPTLKGGARCPAEIRVVYTVPDPIAAFHWRRETGAPLSDGLMEPVSHAHLAETLEPVLTEALAKTRPGEATAALRKRMRAEAKERRGAVMPDGSRLERLELVSLGCAPKPLAAPIIETAAPPPPKAPKPAPAPRQPAFGPPQPFLSSAYVAPGAPRAAEGAETMLRVAFDKPRDMRTQEGATVRVSGLGAHFAIIERGRFEEAFAGGAAGEAHAKLALRLILIRAAEEAVGEVRAADLHTLDLRQRLARPGGALSRPADRLHAGLTLIALDLAEAEYRLAR